MDILKQSLAPITGATWERIKDEASRTLKESLTARQVVDVAGPKGFDFPGVGTGRLELPKQQPAEGITYGIRGVQPLVEVRAPFELSLWEMDNYERGAKDIDLTEVVNAAKKIAEFEETAVYQGFPPGKITGMSEAAEQKNKPIDLGSGASTYLDAVTEAKLALEDQDVEGPYSLVVGTLPYRVLYGTYAGYPLWKQVEKLLEGPIHLSPYIEGGFLVSNRGGDAELILGQDISIGYEGHELKKVRLYLSETFTFRILRPKAMVKLTAAAKPQLQHARTLNGPKAGSREG